MTAEEFVACIAREKEGLLASYLNASSQTAVASDIEKLGLTPDQKVGMRKIIDGVLTDAFYTILLGLDGAASLGGEQRMFQLRDEDGTLLSGELEGPAWQRFHGEGSQ